MLRKRGMTLHGREGACASAFVCSRVGLTDSECKRRIVVKEEGCDVVVEDKEEHVGLLLCEPIAYRLVALEDGSPYGIILFLPVVSEANRGGVGAGDSSNNFCHRANTLPLDDPGRAGLVPPGDRPLHKVMKGFVIG